MSQIDIRRAHALPLKDARAKVERIAAAIAQRFDLECGWDGNTLRFRRSGVEGEIAVAAKAIRVHARLGFLLFALRPAIEREIHRVMDEEFG